MTTSTWRAHADRPDAFYRQDAEDPLLVVDLWWDASLSRWVAVVTDRGATPKGTLGRPPKEPAGAELARWVLGKGINAQHAQTQVERAMDRSAAIERVRRRAAVTLLPSTRAGARTRARA